MDKKDRVWYKRHVMDLRDIKKTLKDKKSIKDIWKIKIATKEERKLWKEL